MNNGAIVFSFLIRKLKFKLLLEYGARRKLTVVEEFVAVEEVSSLQIRG